MGKNIGRFCFLLVSVAILAAIFSFAWKDAHKPEVEVEPNFTVTIHTEPESSTEGITLQTEEVSFTTTLSLDEPTTVESVKKQTSEKPVTETAVSTETTRVIETRVWFEDEEQSTNTTTEEKGDVS